MIFQRKKGVSFFHDFSGEGGIIIISTDHFRLRSCKLFGALQKGGTFYFHSDSHCHGVQGPNSGFLKGWDRHLGGKMEFGRTSRGRPKKMGRSAIFLSLSKIVSTKKQRLNAPIKPCLKGAGF